MEVEMDSSKLEAVSLHNEFVSVVPGFCDAFQDILSSLMKELFRWNTVQNFVGSPSHRCFLQRADVHDTVAKVVVDFVVGRLAQEGFVTMNTVARKQSHAGLRTKPLDVPEEATCSLLMGGGRCYASRRKTRFAMGVGTPVIHLIESRFVVVDDRIPPLIIFELELSICDEARDRHDGLLLWVQACHLSRVELEGWMGRYWDLLHNRLKQEDHLSAF